MCFGDVNNDGYGYGDDDDGERSKNEGDLVE